MRRTLPEWTPPESHGKRPRLLRRLSRQLRDALLKSGDQLRTRLRWVDRHDGSARNRAMYHARVEACGLVLDVLLHYTDLVTLIVGRGHDGTHYGVKLDTIAELTGLGRRRIDRAVRDLHAAGFLASHTRAERTDSGYRGLTAVRQLSIELFHVLGLGTVLQKARTKVNALRKARLEAAGLAYKRIDGKAREFRAATNKRRHGAEARPVTAFLASLLPLPS